MTTSETLKGCAETLLGQASYIGFAPDINANTFERMLNLLAKAEEPLSVLCVGEAASKGLLSVLSASAFLLTDRKLYAEGAAGGIPYTDISAIAYEEEEKKGLFGKTKSEGKLIIRKSNGSRETLAGNIATKEIAEFLNKAAGELKKNPPPALPQKEFPVADKIAGLAQAAFANGPAQWETKPHIADDKLNSFIIHFAPDRTKPSFGAYCKILSSANELYFTDDALYHKAPGGECRKALYSEFASVRYTEKETRTESGSVQTKKQLTVCGKDGSTFFEDTFKLAEERVADFFSSVISEATGTAVKTEVVREAAPPQIAENEENDVVTKDNQNDVTQESNLEPVSHKSLYGQDVAGDAVSENEETKKMWEDLLKKWNEIFIRNEQWVYDGIAIGSHSLYEVYGLKRQDLKGFEYSSGEKSLEFIQGGVGDEKNWFGRAYQFKYSPDGSSDKYLLLAYWKYASHGAALKLKMHSGGEYDNEVKSSVVCSSDSGLFYRLMGEDMYDNMKKFIEKLEAANDAHEAEGKNKAAKDLESW